MPPTFYSERGGYEQFVMISPNSLRLPPGMPGNASTTGVLNTIIEWI
jgi:hypothetical protein